MEQLHRRALSPMPMGPIRRSGRPRHLERPPFGGMLLAIHSRSASRKVPDKDGSVIEIERAEQNLEALNIPTI